MGVLFRNQSNKNNIIKLWSDILAPNDTAITTEELNEVLI